MILSSKHYINILQFLKLNRMDMSNYKEKQFKGRDGGYENKFLRKERKIEEKWLGRIENYTKLVGVHKREMEDRALWKCRTIVADPI